MLPESASYTDTPIPHFQHNGSGYQLLANLGRAFSIPDYVWYQLPDGTVYVGSYADSRFAQTPVDVPQEFAQGGGGGNSLTLPLIPAIRPGVIVNGRRITKVDVTDDSMTLTWTPLNSQGQPAQKSPEQRQIEKLYPELGAGLHLPRMARVMSPTDAAELGDPSDPFRPRYAVNIQLLDENGNAAAGAQEYNAVPMAGSEGGMFQFPPEGTLVEIGFADGRPDKPMIRQTLSEGLSLPAVKPGEQLQQQRAGVSQRVTVDGSWQRDTDQSIEETSSRRSVTSDEENRTTTTRSTTVKANDSTTVLGTKTLMAGQVIQLAEGDYSIGTLANMLTKVGKDRNDDVGQNQNITVGHNQNVMVGQNQTTDVGGALTEKIAGIRRSVAAAQELIAPTVRLGTDDINVLTLLT
uniref:bacteriophage T4 gp5 trimerisation domain-containing protein n=1 Tax=Yersinia pekkanenii TaxID=1288385 RepID=UPI001FD353C0